MLQRIKFLSYLDCAFFALMVGFGETIAVTFLASLKLSGVMLGLLTTLPPAIGAISQALIPNLLRKVSAVRLMLWSVAIQLVGLVGIGTVLLESPFSVGWLGFYLTLYWIGGMTAGSPWQEWLARLIPTRLHNSFFSARSAFMSLVMLSSYLVVGYFLNNRLTQDVVSTLIFVSIGFRLISFAALLAHPSPSVEKEEVAVPELRLDSPHLTANSGAELSLFALCALAFVHRISVCTSAPFFAPYMLQDLGMSTFLYFFINAVPLAVRVLFLRNFGRLLDEKRLYEGLVICTMGIALLPGLWALSSSPGSLVAWQALSGLVWSGFELLTVLFIQQLYPNSIMRSLALFSAAGSLGNAAGGYLGGYIRDLGYSYNELFEFSTLSRFVTGLALIAYLHRKEAFHFRKLEIYEGMTTILSIRPSLSLIGRLLPVSRSLRISSLVTLKNAGSGVIRRRFLKLKRRNG